MEKDKELTKQKLIDAVGELLTTGGYKSLGINKIAKKAGVDKQLIYRYFENVDNLIEAFIIKKDYWTNTVKKVHDAIIDYNLFDTENLINFFLEKQFQSVYNSDILQQMMLWSISEPNIIMSKVVEMREEIVNDLLKVTDERFKDSNVNFRAISAITIAGLYYIILHSKVNSGAFCEINIREDEGKSEILNAIKMINGWAFQASVQERAI